MIASPKARAFALAIAVLSTSCRGSDGKGAPDAGHAAAKPAKPAVVRTAAAGERLADLDASRISLAIVKDREVALPVNATLALSDGRLLLDGANPSARLTIDLSTFDTKIPLRNERVKSFFFETSGVGWETAELVIPKLPDDALAALRDGKRAPRTKLDAELTLHGKKSKLALVVDAGYEADGTLRIKSSAPFDLKISDFGLADNLKHLSSICMHDSIDDLVKVDVVLDFPAGK